MHAVNFYSVILQADQWTLNVLQNGLLLPFYLIPPVYCERNNRSALDNLDKLKSIIGEWELDGKCLKVSVKPRCVNLPWLYNRTQ